MLCDLLTGVTMNTPPAGQPQRPVRSGSDFFQYQIGRDRVGRSSAFTQPFIGDVAYPTGAALNAGRVADINPIQQQTAARQRALPGQHFGQMFLTVAVHPGDTDDFTRPELQLDPPQRAFTGFSRGVRIAQVQPGCANGRGPFLTAARCIFIGEAR